MKKILLISGLFFISFLNKSLANPLAVNDSLTLTVQQANALIKLPLKCYQQEYPNKTSQVLGSEKSLGTPQNLHPIFYGCFDWHSAVHGHWVMVKLVNDFIDLENRNQIIELLKQQITPEKVAQEIAYFNRHEEKNYERTYGWAWLLKLSLELETSPETDLQNLGIYLKPLTTLLIERYIEFLPKLVYPIRVGTHNNTAFGMNFAYEYALFSSNTPLKDSIEKNAKRLYTTDCNCPLTWEPSGTDFLSPCLEEVNLMRKILPKKEFIQWLKQFMPQIFNPKFDVKPALVLDRTDGHLVHLDGLNFSRAWIFYGLAHQYPKEFKHLNSLADKHLKHSLPTIVDGYYAGEHWLASFAIYALSERGHK